MIAPKKILITSDENEMEYVGEVKAGKEILFRYRYIKSETKKDRTVEFSESNLKKLFTVGTFKEIK